MTYRDVTHPDDRDEDHAAYQRVVVGKEPEYWAEKRYVRKDGKVIWVAVNAVVLRDEHGAPIHSVGVIHEITERKKLERKLAELAVEERQRLGRDLHDSVSQQLSAIGMMISALHTRPITGAENTRELLSRLESSIEQAKTQLGRVLTGLLPFDVAGNDLFAALKRLAQEASGMDGCKCLFESERSTWKVESIVATQLYLIAREAVSNAVRHAGASQILIRLDSVSNDIVLTIQDDGSGIATGAHEEGMGIRIMNFRAGLIAAKLHVESPGSGGTIVRCHYNNRRDGAD